MYIYVVVYIRILMYAAYAKLQNVLSRVRATRPAHGLFEKKYMHGESLHQPHSAYTLVNSAYVNVLACTHRTCVRMFMFEVHHIFEFGMYQYEHVHDAQEN